jgi:hypothetical protein
VRKATVGLVQHRIGNSGADSCKLNTCNSIGHLCKCWADVFQMPHHRQYVNRCKQFEMANYFHIRTLTFTATVILVVVFISCGQSPDKIIPQKIEDQERKFLDFDTSKIAIFSFDEITRHHFDSSYVAAELTQDELNDVHTLLIACVTNYNNSLPIEHKQKGIDLVKNTYKKQLLVVRNKKGQKEVWVNCLCSSGEGNLWKMQILQYEDGGKCFFNFKINLTTREFYDLSINGSA